MKELTTEVKQALLAPFQAAEVRVRTNPYVAAYVTARVVMTRLDEAIPWQWSFKLVGAGTVDANGVMHQDGVLVIQGPDGRMLEFHDRGSAPPDIGRGQAKQAKHAVSDCFKRCAVHAGVGRYLYELQGVQGGRVPKAALEKALAAVGYYGPWDDRHHGVIGGIREADLEDEPEDLSLPQPTVEPTPAKAKPSRTENVTESEKTTPRTESNEKAAKPSNSVKIGEDQKTRIEAAVERGGGNIQSATFLGWLAKNTANHAATLDDILGEDVDELVRKLDELASRRKATS